ncbi:nif11-like leader peptide domain protein [Synechococcus sp. BIOS-E4-1]|uniref:Nif11-like leader peptide family natural product precursor n=1 Tax=Synechococcus sp. BIOS-E4-1 TaxID=1400864 RepID=UPI00164642A6|nr:Nif11-like leader peptide family natural product precursor [Synechococcus sp. BIOS-E4-1]QNI53167.1 nif11-like leader peptide domain protein [Synechococcus sp. BIOS-E4-1]
MSDAEQDQILEQFIALAKADQSLQDEIKAALNQDQVIAIAAERGFLIDPLAILRKWSKHTDFSKPTWMGWFSE